MRYTISPLSLVLALGLPVAALAQSSSDTLSLDGRTNLMIGIGLTGTRDASATPGQASTHASGEVGSFAFNHWVRPSVAVTISAAALNVDTRAGSGHATTNAITPLLFGLSYSPRALALSTSIRPFVALAAGPYLHAIADAGAGAATTRTETVAGARMGAGTNWFVARHFMLSLEADYHAVGKFDYIDAVSKDPSGFGLSFGFGFSWGGKY